MDELENNQEFPEWIFTTTSKSKQGEDKITFHIDEPKFCEVFKKEYDLVRINGAFYLDGEKTTDDYIRSIVQDKIVPYFKEKTGRRTEDLFKTLCNDCFTDQPEPDEWKIYCKGNITLNLNREGKITQKEEKIFTLTRLPVNFDLNARCPVFEKYLKDLLFEDDIPAVQEFLGYCLVPSTRAQAGLFIHGEGGEGKSVLRDVVMRLFGHSAVQEGIHKLGERFTLIQLENRLVCVDDDMRTELLNETETIKKLITAKGKFQLEDKFVSKRDAYLYARVLAIGNTFIGSKFDHSDGFYRRQLLIDCKPKTRSEKDDDRFMSDKCIEEIDGIFVWALLGLSRLIKNNYNFTISKRMRDTLDGVKHDGNNVLTFTEDQTAIQFTNQFSDYVTSADLVKVYVLWCWDNGESVIKKNSFARQFPKIYKLNINEPSCGKGLVPGGNGQVQGYTGVRLSKDMEDRLTGLTQQDIDKINRLP